ncbi:MAG: DoxX family protein [Candidatus Omnitrophota bacterium]|nr:DoxX family protein [Candidatus Omnitrophota bacterium]MDZ4242202.1 DoxX family protein [Candidatus Omnitrophota bacterium]
MKDLGLLILRVGIGIMFIHHGYGKLAAGPEMWTKVGGALALFGINFAPQFFGLMAALSEFAGGACLVLGLFARYAAAFMFFTMVVASNMHLAKGDGINGASHAIEMGIVFLSLVLIGAGAYSLDDRLRKKAGKAS